MIAPARALTARIGAVAATVAVLCLGSCRPRVTPVPPEYLLAPAFEEAEVRSDGFDLAFLVKSGAFRWPGRQSAEDKAVGHLTSLNPLKARNPDLVINLMGCWLGSRAATTSSSASPSSMSSRRPPIPARWWLT